MKEWSETEPRNVYSLKWRWLVAFIWDSGEPGEEADKLNEDEGSISPLLFEDSPPDLQPEGNPSLLNSKEQSNLQIRQNSVVFGPAAAEGVKEIRFRSAQKPTLPASAGI